MHFTRVEHLSTILEAGLLSDSLAQAAGLLTIEVGNVSIKAQRARAAVPCAPGGSVSEYVPMYFAQRSPMMYAIHKGNVPTYDGGCDRLVYITSTLEAIRETGGEVLLTDRNAALSYAEFWSLSDGEPPTGLIDWGLMRQRMWNNTPADPDRKERRMAECLVHRTLPARAITAIVAKSGDVATEAAEAVRSSGLNIPVDVRRDWYF